MEEYIGASLMIKTNTATHIGILQNIELERQRIIVEVSGAPQAIDIEEIDEVEIIPEEDSQIFLTQTESTNTCKTVPNVSVKEETAKISTSVEFVSASVYEEMVALSDAVYGPSREEIVYSGSRGALHLFVNIFKAMKKKFVVYIGTGIFSEIAISLARLFVLYNSEVTLIPSGKTARIVKELLYYESNGGVVSHERKEESFVIIADVKAEKEMVEGAEKVLFLGDYQNIDHPSKDVIFFGAPIKDPYEFSGSAILCDVGFSLHVHQKYNLKRYTPKLLQKIAK